MNLLQFIEYLESSTVYSPNISRIVKRESKAAEYSIFPDYMPENMVNILNSDGIKGLYSHQRQALDFYQSRENFVITTPTASGKTLSYLLPVLLDKLKHPQGRHLFMFPTKALAQDQLATYRHWAAKLEVDWKISTFDGDTSPDERRNVKAAGDFILTNPDMLHSGILPHHNNWKNLFQNLRTIILDEMHIYSGIFGSSVANVLRRLNRILENYGANPVFIFSSATIANPEELAASLTGKKFYAIKKSGAPEGEKYFMFYNPPVLDREGTRESPYRAAATIGAELLGNKLATLFFTRSRNRAEILRDLLLNRVQPELKSQIQSYRGGYLPLERRNIEHRMRNKDLLGIISTNALELGIDIGILSAVVSVGYPGRIGSVIQQFGRAGRQKEPALAILVATMGAMDQYLMKKEVSNLRFSILNLLTVWYF